MATLKPVPEDLQQGHGWRRKPSMRCGVHGVNFVEEVVVRPYEAVDWRMMARHPVHRCPKCGPDMNEMVEETVAAVLFLHLAARILLKVNDREIANEAFTIASDVLDFDEEQLLSLLDLPVHVVRQELGYRFCLTEMTDARRNELANAIADALKKAPAAKLVTIVSFAPIV
jgi:hypothetical protein